MTARIVHVVNPVAPLIGARVFEDGSGAGVLDMLDRAAWRLPNQTLLVRGGRLVKRVDWNAAPLADGETAVLLTMPAGKGGGSQIFAIIAQIALMIVAPYIAGTLLGLTGIFQSIATVAIVLAGKMLISAIMPKPKAFAPVKDQSPTYSLTPQSNAARLGQMVPEHFGRYQHVPDLAAQPYFGFVDDAEQLFELFNLGIGTYEIESVSIGDTVIWADGGYTGVMPEIVLQFVQPGDVMTLFPDNVVTSVDVSSVTMLGTNEKNYAQIGPFVLSKPGTAANRVEIDIQCPGGLFIQDGDGLTKATLEFAFQAQAIDNSGNPTGDWFTIIDETLQLAQRDAVRRTYGYNFTTPGRYRVQGQRTNTKAMGGKASDIAVWFAMRGFLPSKGIYPGCTMMALKATSDANLNSNSATQIKVLKTRMLSVWDADASEWTTDPAATRNPAAVARYIAMASNGAGLPDSRVDLAKLAQLYETWDGRGDYFDGIYDNQQSLLEAIQAAVQVGRARMIMVGSIMSFVRDEARVLPRAAFSPRNILPNSLKITYLLHDVNAVEALAVSYVDSRLWQPHTVLCKFDDSDITLEEATPIQFFGIVDYAHGWREGIAMVAASRYRRRLVEMRTELDGRVCQFGDLVSFSHYLPSWGFSADVLSIENHDDGDVLLLSEPYSVPAGQEEEPILIRIATPDGQVYGPVECTIVPQDALDPRNTLVKLQGTATVAGKYAGQQPRDWPVWSAQGLQLERPRATLGQGTVAPRDALVLKMAPQDSETTTVNLVLDNPLVYAADTGTPPDDPYDPDGTPSVDLTITSAVCTETPGTGSNTNVSLRMNGAADATGYYLQHRALPDGVYSGDPQRFDGSPSGGHFDIAFSVPNGATELQLSAFNPDGIGPVFLFRFTADGADDTAPGDVGSVNTTVHWSSGHTGTWNWSAVAGALSYVVIVQARKTILDDFVNVRTVEIDAPPYSYYPANETQDGGPFGWLKIGVKAKNEIGQSPDYSFSDIDG